MAKKGAVCQARFAVSPDDIFWLCACSHARLRIVRSVALMPHQSPVAKKKGSNNNNCFAPPPALVHIYIRLLLPRVYRYLKSMTLTTWLRAIGGILLAMSACSSATLLTMAKVGGFESLSEDAFEIVVVKPSTNVSYYFFCHGEGGERCWFYVAALTFFGFHTYVHRKRMYTTTAASCV